MLPNLEMCTNFFCSELNNLKIRADEDLSVDEDLLSEYVYIIDKLKLDYLETIYNTDNCSKLIPKIIEFRDSHAWKLIKQKCVNNIDYLSTKIAMERAFEVFLQVLDLDSLLKILNNNDSKLIELLYQAYPDKNECMGIFIKLNYTEGVRFLALELENYQVKSFIYTAYHMEYFAVAEILLNCLTNSNDLKMSYIRANPKAELALYLDHLDYLNQSQILARNNFEVLYHYIRYVFNIKDNCFFYCILDLVKQANIFDSIALQLNESRQSVFDVLRFFFIKSSDFGKVHLMLPEKGYDSFYFAGDINFYYKEQFVYLPLSEELRFPIFVHEYTHALMLILFENNCLPFSNNEQSKESDYLAANQNFLNNLMHTFTKSHNLTELKTFFFFSDYYMNKNHDENLDIKFAKEMLFDFYEFKLDLKYKNHTEKMHIIENYFKNIALDLGYDFSSLMLFLHRISDWYFRGSEIDRQVEFIVRLPELHAAGVDDKLMELFKPIEGYWQKYISPKVQLYIDKHYQKCVKIIENHSDHDQCAMIALSNQQVTYLFEYSILEKFTEIIKNICEYEVILEKVNTANKKDICEECNSLSIEISGENSDRRL